jgi:flavodoxin
MKKRTISILVLAAVLLVSVGCQGVEAPKPSSPTATAGPDSISAENDLYTSPGSNATAKPSIPAKEAPLPENGTLSNILVAYFSATGTTERIAGYIAGQTGADLYRITPETPYTQEDLDYGNSSARAATEQNDTTARPAISGLADGMENYGTVFIGYPIWFGQAPKIISTFLESYDFGGKTIVPFCTSGSSGIGSSDTDLHGLVSDSVNWMPGERFPSDTTEESIKEWIDGLGI